MRSTYRMAKSIAVNRSGGTRTVSSLLSPTMRRLVGGAVTILAVAAVCWLLASILFRLALVSFALAAALLLPALLSPFMSGLRRLRVPKTAAAAIAVLVLIGFPTAVGLLLWNRVGAQLEELGPALTAGVDDIRTWLTTGPLSLDAAYVDRIREEAVGYVRDAVPGPVAGARTAVHVLTALALAVFAVFFFLKDGAHMWRWLVLRTPHRQRASVDGAGHEAWRALEGYVSAVTIIALIDATLIGLALFLVGVPLWLSLSLLTFVGAYVPILGATVSGGAATLVTLVTTGGSEALIILVVVLVVQQVEGNLLQPLVMGRAVDLHPVVTVVAVTSGTLLLGIAGAVLAVPLVAVIHRVFDYVRTAEHCERGPTHRLAMATVTRALPPSDFRR